MMYCTLYFPRTCLIIGNKIKHRKAQHLSHIGQCTLSVLFRNPQCRRYYYPTIHIYKTLHALRQSMQYVLAAGVIATHKAHCLFIYRLGHWDLPKGKREGTESMQTTAIRELYEETGLQVRRPLRFLTESYHCYEIRGKYFLKKTLWYLAAAAENKFPLQAQQEEHIEKAEWVHRDHIARNILPHTYPNIRDVLGKIKYL